MSSQVREFTEDISDLTTESPLMDAGVSSLAAPSIADRLRSISLVEDADIVL